MGAFGINISSSSFDDNSQNSNPNPYNYNIIDSLEKNGYLVIMVEYPDCNNYEGKKILVYENCTLLELVKQKQIDPHFSENKDFYSPIARFEPTIKGWLNAMKII